MGIITCSFKNYLKEFDAEKYPHYFGLDADFSVCSNDKATYLHRKAGYYFRAAMILGEAHPLTVGKSYCVEFKVKLNKFAQTNGAIKLLNNASPSYPWAPVTEYSKENKQITEDDYVDAIALKDLLDGKVHTVKLQFTAKAPYISLNTPGYAELDFSDFVFEELPDSTQIDNVKLDYTEYTQVRVEDAKYYVACELTKDYDITLSPKTVSVCPVLPEKFTVADNELSGYTYVLPRVHSYLYTEGLDALNSALERVGIKLNMCYDEEISTDKLIFVGNTSFSAPVKEKDSYSIFVKDGNLYINGGSDLSVYTALRALADIIVQNGEKGKGINIKDNCEFYSGKYLATGSNYQITFEDEFTDKEVNKSVWGNFWGRSARYSTGNNAIGGGHYCASPLDNAPYAISADTSKKVLPIEIIDNKLHMRSIRAKEIYEGGKKVNKTDCDVLESCISTIGKLHYKYGVLEISCQIAGGANYAALWANGDISGVMSKFPTSGRTAFCEFDLTESFGYGDYAAPCIHKWWRNGEGYLSGHNSIDFTSSDGYGDWKVKQIHDNEREGFLGKGHYFSTEQHIYTYSWTPDGITIAIDGKVVWDYDYTKYKGTSICDMTKHIIMTSDFSKYLKPDSPEIMDQIIDYVRIYQIPDRGDCLIYSIDNDNFSK